jgi:hypothetical protein
MQAITHLDRRAHKALLVLKGQQVQPVRKVPLVLLVHKARKVPQDRMERV